MCVSVLVAQSCPTLWDPWTAHANKESCWLIHNFSQSFFLLSSPNLGGNWPSGRNGHGTYLWADLANEIQNKVRWSHLGKIYLPFPLGTQMWSLKLEQPCCDHEALITRKKHQQAADSGFEGGKAAEWLLVSLRCQTSLETTHLWLLEEWLRGSIACSNRSFMGLSLPLHRKCTQNGTFSSWNVLEDQSLLFSSPFFLSISFGLYSLTCWEHCTQSCWVLLLRDTGLCICTHDLIACGKNKV